MAAERQSSVVMETAIWLRRSMQQLVHQMMAAADTNAATGAMRFLFNLKIVSIDFVADFELSLAHGAGGMFR